MNARKEKIIAVVGPTASGKSDFAVELALRLGSGQTKKLNGEIISADSRQVYKGLNIGTGKVPISHEPLASGESAKSSTPPAKQKNKTTAGGAAMYYRGVRHYLLDIASPKRRFTVTQYQRLARKALKKIIARGKIPIICGGTGFYIDALLSGADFPNVPPNYKLRQKLEKETAEKLFSRLKKLDQQRAANIDRYNKRRLIRALEIISATGKKIPALLNSSGQILKPKNNFEVLKIGLLPPPNILKNKIHLRLQKRLRQGMIAEAKKLHRGGLSWKRMEELGLEYRYLARYLHPQGGTKNKISKKEMAEQLEKEIWRYAKRQLTWFRRDPKIIWPKNKKCAFGAVKKFLRTF